MFLYPSVPDADAYGMKVLNKGWSVFYHNRDNELTELNYKPADLNNKVNCIETDGLWEADKSGLVICNHIAITRFRNLFGPAGVACRNAKIGVSAVWTSPESRQRGAVKGSEFCLTEGDFETAEDRSSCETELMVEFRRPSLRGEVTVSVILYIAEPGTPGPDEKHLANEKGLILGTIDTFTLLLDGNGSLFPVYEVYEPDKPLWYVRCDWIDPLTDSFSETVSININKAHKDFKYIDQTQNTFCKQLLTETMAAAVCCIIEEARNSEFWDQITDDESHEHGSVAEAIKYFQDTLKWDLASPLSLSESVRSFFDGRITY